MGARHYASSIDIWSVGCIFAELLSRHILFQAQSPIQQVCRAVTRLAKSTHFPSRLPVFYYFYPFLGLQFPKKICRQILTGREKKVAILWHIHPSGEPLLPTNTIVVSSLRGLSYIIIVRVTVIYAAVWVIRFSLVDGLIKTLFLTIERESLSLCVVVSQTCLVCLNKSELCAIIVTCSMSGQTTYSGAIWWTTWITFLMCLKCCYISW